MRGDFMKQFYTAPTRKIKITDGEYKDNKVVYTIVEKTEAKKEKEPKTEVEEEKKEEENLNTPTPPEYRDILDNSDIIQEKNEFYYNWRGKLLTKSGFVVPTIEDIPDMIEYHIKINNGNLKECEILFINPMELVKIEKEENSSKGKESPKQRIKSIFRKQK